MNYNFTCVLQQSLGMLTTFLVSFFVKNNRHGGSLQYSSGTVLDEAIFFKMGRAQHSIMFNIFFHKLAVFKPNCSPGGVFWKSENR